MNKNSEVIQLFKENGFVKLPFKINMQLIDQAVSDIKGKYLYENENYNLNNRIENAWNFSDAVGKIAGDENILKFLNEIFDGDAFPFQTLNFEKGSQQKIHSDFYHFASSNFENMAGVWVALEDISENAGPLSVVPGSHKLPYIFPEDIKLEVGTKSNPYQYYSLYENSIQEIIEREKLKVLDVVLNKGEILVWHSNLLHGGSKVIDSEKTRLSQVTHYFKKGDFYFSPIQSKRNIFLRRYRIPFNVTSGRRIIPLIG